MGDFTRLAQKVVSVARGDEKKKPSPYDTKAVVNRIDLTEKKAYVRFYGGVDETPVDLTINCEKGDTVQVRVGGGRAWITGNLTAPPTDDKAVTILNHTVNNLKTQMKKSVDKLEEEIEEFEPGGEIERIATEYILSTSNTEVLPYDDMDWSEELPEWVASPRTYYWKRTVIYYTDGTTLEQDPELDANAQITAEVDYAESSTNNHFWSDSTGAYVTEEDHNAALGYANRVTNAGILQTYNGNLLTAWTGSGITFYDGSGSTAASSTALAIFGSSGISFDTTTPFTIGNNSSYIKWINTGTDVSPNWKLQINADTIQFGGNDVVTSNEINLYTIETSVESIIQNVSTTTPTSLSVYFYNAEEEYTGRIRVQKSTNGTSWSLHYNNYDSDSYTVPLSSSTYKYYKIEMYENDDSSYTTLLASKTIPVIANGVDGDDITITSTSVTYASSSSATTTPSSFPYSSPPSVSPGYYLWTKTYVLYSDGNSTTSYSVARQGENGTDVTSQYVTYISSTYGVRVHHAGTGTSYPYLQCNADGVSLWKDASHYSIVDSTGMKIYAGSTSYPVAQFGSSIVIGSTNSYYDHLEITSNGVDIYDGTIKVGSLKPDGSEHTISLESIYSSSKYAKVTVGATDDAGSIELFTNSISMVLDYGEVDFVKNGNSILSVGSQVKIGETEHDVALQNQYCYESSAISSGKNVVINSNYTFRNGTASSRRYKTDIGEIIDYDLLPEKLYDLPVIQFKFKPGYLDEEDELYDKYVPGIIAEDVERIYPRAATHLDGYVENWDERRLLPPMLALIQNQKKMIDDLTLRVESLEGGRQ